MSEVFAFMARGVNGQLYVLPDRVRISRAGALAFLTQGLKGDKDIRIEQISSIQLKLTGFVTNGYFQLAFIGGRETKGGIFDAVSDENTVVFDATHEKEFVRAKELIEWYQAQTRTTPASGDLANLEKLAELRDKGIVTESEFQAKKAQLLGLGPSVVPPPAWLEEAKGTAVASEIAAVHIPRDPFLVALDDLAGQRRRGEITPEEFAAKRGQLVENRPAKVGD